MIMPEYPLIKEHRWSSDELEKLTLEQISALWIHSSIPFRHLLFDAMTDLKKYQVFDLFDSGQVAALHFMWRGAANQYNTRRVGEKRNRFINEAEPDILGKFWLFMTPGEKHIAFSGLTESESRQLFVSLPDSEKIINWRWLGKHKERIWSQLSDEEQRGLSGLLDAFRVTLESICIDGKCPLDYNLTEHQNAFNAAYHDLKKHSQFVTVADMAAALGVTEQTVRNRVAAYGYTVRKGDIHPPAAVGNL